MSPVLFLHIVAGGVGLLAGAAALTARKGEPAHRAAGTAFFVSMLAMSGLGTYLGALKPTGLAVIPGILTFYLVATAWATVRREAGTTGRFEIGVMLLALGVAAAGLALGLQANGPAAVVYYVFGSVAALAAGLDLRVVRLGGVSGAPRITRHLWRMCVALLIAAFSFFIGQQKVFPEALRGSPILFAPPLATFAVMIFWLFRVRFSRGIRQAATAA